MRSFVALALISAVAVVAADPIIFYDHIDYKGPTLSVDPQNGDCVNLPSEWNDRISSVNTNGRCIIAYEHGGCTGKTERIGPGTRSHNNLKEIQFDDMMSSYRLCGDGGNGGNGGSSSSSGNNGGSNNNGGNNGGSSGSSSSSSSSNNNNNNNGDDC